MSTIAADSFTWSAIDKKNYDSPHWDIVAEEDIRTDDYSHFEEEEEDKTADQYEEEELEVYNDEPEGSTPLDNDNFYDKQTDHELQKFHTVLSLSEEYPVDRELKVPFNVTGFEMYNNKQIDEEEEVMKPQIDEEETDEAEENLTPSTLKMIDENVEVREVPGKGRCCFTKRSYKPGEIIFVELPTLVAVPSIDIDLWRELTRLNEEEAFDLPPVWHLAALYSATKLSEKGRSVLLQKWVPDLHVSDKYRPAGSDVKRILRNLDIDVDPKLYERYLQVWRYNSFGHHAETEGISMMAHDCRATACWHYGEKDAFVLRARHYLEEGDELCISYLGDDDLFKSINVRQDKLAGWLFKCACERCSSSVDLARGFRCPKCGTGSVFLRTEREPNSQDPGITTASSCSACSYRMSKKTIQRYLEFEAAYISRLEETDKSDLPDVETVYSEAQRVFHQHWVLFTLDGILFDAYREKARYLDAVTYQNKRIQYATATIPQPSYTLAWLYEEKGDALMNACDEQIINACQKNQLCDSYETAMNLLLVLCGWHHEYTLAAHKKLERILNIKPIDGAADRVTE